jgi:hypothetical protein
MDQPAVIVDCHGRIITWYLPGILTQPRVVNSDRYLNDSLINKSH